ncbi:MAG: sulfatase [Fuerstiella sp.]
MKSTPERASPHRLIQPKQLHRIYSMVITRRMIIALLLLSYFAPFLSAQENGAQPPNFIIIFCDDMGYADIGPFGAQGYQTPHLDRMAQEGLKFTDFYAGRSFCSPSRAALMTGCIPTRVGVGGNFGPRSTNGLNPEEMTIAEVLKQQNYATACFGKWHLGHQPQFLPPNQGFDEYYGIPYSNDMWPYHPAVRHLAMEQRLKRWPHLPLYEGLEIINPQVMPADQIPLTTNLFERAMKFIESHKSEPFFIYLPSPQPHVPLFVSDKYKGKTERGLFGDVISEIDWGVGQIIDTLKKNGIDKNTCVVFTSDNGPWLSYGDHGGSAKPLREGKGTNFEGGFRVPCLMRWPGTIPSGKVSAEVVGTIDLLPTFARIAGAALPNRKIDGRDISDLMFGKPGATTPHDVFYHYDGGNRLMAVRSGKWKLMFAQSYNSPIPGKGGIPGKVRRKNLELSLFDLENDIGETTNLADRHPDVVERLKQHAENMRKDLGEGKDAGPGRRPPGQS